jgi:hypothetical protein
VARNSPGTSKPVTIFKQVTHFYTFPHNATPFKRALLYQLNKGKEREMLSEAWQQTKDKQKKMRWLEERDQAQYKRNDRKRTQINDGTISDISEKWKENQSWFG